MISSLYAQDGAYTGFTPYSIFGIGDINSQGSAYNKSMGGTGIASRNKRYINYLNPAAVTARDSLSFMADMSLVQDNKVMRQDGLAYVNNTFNVNNIAISFPIYRSSAMLLGIAPYSSTGYSYSYVLDDPAIVGNTGNAVYYSAGKGSTYQLFAAAGVTFWKRLSLGVEGIMYFGNIDKASSFTFAKSAYSGISSSHSIVVRGTSAKFGLQYEQPIGTKTTIGIGATYSLGSNLSGYVEQDLIAAGTSQNDTLKFVSDTIGRTTSPICIPTEKGIGISITHADTWRLEFDYTRSDWTGSGMESVNGFGLNSTSVFSTALSESYRAGFEIVPNRNDIRYYYKRCAYRMGAYYQNSYYAVDGNQVKDMGLTLGVSLPVYRYFNAVTLAMNLGQRASLADNMIRERYVTFTVGFNFHDYWFHKQMYD